jgi:AmmeMemoRadiSam system protein A
MTTPPAPLSVEDRALLLEVARTALRHHLGLGPPPAIPGEGALGQRRGAFVTLRVDGALRGSLGTLQPAGPLARTVVEMAVAAASRDPRFPPLSPAEVEAADVRVSVLGALQPMRRPSDVVVGRHGLMVISGWHRGALLPAAAVEGGWSAETFLDRACLEAGLPPHVWREADALALGAAQVQVQVELFEAEEFGFVQA